MPLFGPLIKTFENSLAGRTRFIFSRDQWDVHVLDPVYDCLLRVAPHCPMITRKPGTGIYDPSKDLPKVWENPYDTGSHRRQAPRPASSQPHNTTPLSSQPTFCDPPDRRATVEDDDVSMRTARSTPCQSFAPDTEDTEEYGGRTTPHAPSVRMQEDPPTPPTPPTPRQAENTEPVIGMKRKGE